MQTDDNLTVAEQRERDAQVMEDPLRNSVRMLGRILGEVLVEQGGPGLLEEVEAIRKQSIELRGNFSSAGQAALLERCGRLDLDRSFELVLAFTTYFHLVNLAEERGRLRTLEQREVKGGDRPRSESIGAALRQLKEEGVAASEVRRLLGRMLVEPVFTAHPTESRRRSVLGHLQEIEEVMARLDQPALTPTATRQAEDDLRRAVTSLWQTDEIRAARPTPLLEVANILYYFEHSIYGMTPRLYRDLEQALLQNYPGEPFMLPAFLRYNNWTGADRDGNPYVTSQVTAQTARGQKDLILRLYSQSLTRLAIALSNSSRRAKVSPALYESLNADRRRMPHLAIQVEQHSLYEAYRQKLAYIQERLRLTIAHNQAQTEAALAAQKQGLPASEAGLGLAEDEQARQALYRAPSELLADLAQIETQLAR